MRKLITLANILAPKYDGIPLSQVKLERSGLREESFEFLRKHSPKGHVEIAEMPGEVMFVQDGRHRILLALERGDASIPVMLREYDADGNTLSLGPRELLLRR